MRGLVLSSYEVVSRVVVVENCVGLSVLSSEREVARTLFKINRNEIVSLSRRQVKHGNK